MLIAERQRKILELLKEKPDLTVKELAKILMFSEPTIRRDFTELHQKGLITKKYGGAILNNIAADQEIPFYVRENEKSPSKVLMAIKAKKHLHDGMVVMLDGSTSAFHLVPVLAQFKNIIVITSGAKTAVALAERNINTYATGGKMIINSYSYVGKEAEDFVKRISADILFFSCRGLSLNGEMSDVSTEEASLRTAMFKRCKKKILLLDSSKIGKDYFYVMGHLSEIDEIISEIEIPIELKEMLKKN